MPGGKKAEIQTIFDDPDLPYNEPLVYASTGQPWHDWYTVLGMLIIREEARVEYLAEKHGLTVEQVRAKNSVVLGITKMKGTGA